MGPARRKVARNLQHQNAVQREIIAKGVGNLVLHINDVVYEEGTAKAELMRGMRHHFDEWRQWQSENHPTYPPYHRHSVNVICLAIVTLCSAMTCGVRRDEQAILDKAVLERRYCRTSKQRHASRNHDIESITPNIRQCEHDLS